MDPEAHPFSIITEADAVNVSPKNRADTPPGKGWSTFCFIFMNLIHSRDLALLTDDPFSVKILYGY